MANTFITLKNIARETLMQLKQNIVMPQLCYRDFKNDFTDNGATVQVKKPPKYEAKKHTAGSNVVVQDITEDTVDVTLDNLAYVNVKWGDLEAAVSLGEQKVRNDVIIPSAYTLAEQINKDGLLTYKKIGNRLGIAGTTPSAISDLSDARLFLNKAKAPVLGRVAIWDPDADAKLVQIDNLRKVNEAGQNDALREGEIGRVLGLDNYMSQGIEKHVKGTLAATGSGAKILLNGAATASKEVELDTGGTALTGTLKAGDVLTFGTGTSAIKRVVAQDATAESNIITVKLIDALTAADNTEVSVGADYAANIVMHRNAIAFVNRPLVMPQGGAEGYVVTDPDSNIALRVTRGYDMNTKTNQMSIDILYGYALVYPELAAVYMG